MTVIRALALGVLVLLGTAATALAAPLTLNFSGSIDLTMSGGSKDNPFSGFFTWDPIATPGNGSDNSAAFYPLLDYQVALNGVEPDPALGAGLILLNDADLLGTGTQDVFAFFAPIKTNLTVNGVTGDAALVGAIVLPSTFWTTAPSLPQDYSFLSLMTTSFSSLSLEVPGGGDDNDVTLGSGSFAVRPVPEPASLTLTALGLAGAVARGRRARQRV
jgi:hypothetical protein